MYGHTIRRWAFAALAVACAGGAQAQTAGPLTIALEAAGSFKRAHDWSIDKQVTPASADRFIGDTQQFAYTLHVTKGDVVESDFLVQGRVVITNSGSSDAALGTVTGHYDGSAIQVTCPVSTLTAGASTTCPIEFEADSATKQALTVTLQGGESATSNVTFTAGTDTRSSISVTDSMLDAPVTFADSGSHQYVRSATCANGDTVKIDNTATIVETGESDTVRARLACHALRMERSVQAQGGTRWSWEIDKSHALTGPVELAAGASQDVVYTITASATPTSGGNLVVGAITGINTHPGSTAQLVSVGAAINGIAAPVDCPSLVVPSASYDANRNIVLGRLSCPFSVTLPDGMTATSVSGRITQQLFTYAPDGSPTPATTRDLAGTQPISGPLAAGSTDECVALADVYLGSTADLGEFCASDGSTTVTRTFTGAIAVNAQSECAFSVPNLARLTTNDSGTIDEDGTTVAVERTDCAAEEPTGTLEASITGSGAFTRRYPWTIDKQVTPASSDRFIGETQELAYTLTLTRGEPQDAGYVVTGNATITNNTAFEADISAITITYGGNPVTHACAMGALAAGASRTCALQFNAPDDDPQGLLIDVDTRGGVTGAEANTMVTFAGPAVTGETITVRDTLLPETLTFGESGTHRYTHDATCVDGNTVVVNNTATIVETGESDSASARVACHATRMERSVATFGGTDWTWDLTKTHAATLPLQVVAGQSYNVDYTITATATAGGDGAGKVHGAITAINTHPSVDAVVLSVAARINGTDAVVTCPTPMIAPHATYDANRNIVVGKLVCPFTVTLAAGETPATVTGRVEQQLFDYDSQGHATPDGTRVLQGTQPVGALPAAASNDECIDLVDVYLGTSHELGEFCVSEGSTSVSRTFTGAIAVTADHACEFAVPNLARLTASDTGTIDEASTSVTVERTDCEADEPGGTLELGITGSGAFTRTIPWTIDKSVTPASSDRFIGETQQLAYTLTLTKGDAADAGFRVTGNATFVNHAATAADITAVTLAYGDAPVPNSCATGPLAAGESRTCAIDFETVTDDPKLLSMHVATRGDVAGGQASTMVAFGAPVVTGEQITVDDTLLPEDLTFSATGTHRYTHDAKCVDGNTVVVDNTATIVETGESDSARARVACHAIRMERTVSGTGAQSYSWNVEKTHGLMAPLQLEAGQTHDVAYSITATATANATGGGAGTVHGAITAINTNPVTAAVILSVQAWINNTPATVTCPMPMLAPRAAYDADRNIQVGKLVCPFVVTLAAGETAATVKGRVEQQLYRHDSEGHPTADGTKVLEGTQPAGNVPAGQITDECVRMTDHYLGVANDLGEFCVSQGQLSVTRTFTGPITVTSGSECEYSVANMGRIVANDSGATDESTTSVAVERRDCAVEQPVAACTRTQGYWRTHSINGPAPYDATWARIGETTPFFLASNGQAPLSWYGVMWMSPKGNAYYQLAPQFVAATLNTLAGVQASAPVLDALDEAQALLEIWTPAQIGMLRGTAAPRPRFVELADVLDRFNNGQLGPNHCEADKHAPLASQ